MFQSTVKSLLEERKKLHPNDPAIQQYWEKLTILLSKEEQQTIDFLYQCKQEEILLLSEIFEDISLHLQSQNFIKALKKIQEKFPTLKLHSSIEIAEKYARL